MTRDEEGLLYNCYRASCDTYGRASGRSLTAAPRPERRDCLKPFTGALHELTDEWREYLHGEVGFDAEHVRVARARRTDEGRIAFPILDPIGKRRGFCLRSYTGGVPKALTRMDTHEPHTSYYRADEWERGPECWLVEDIPSAVRAARYVDTVALLGTTMTDEAAEEVAKYYRRVVWALDADATTTALAQRRTWALHFQDASVQVLECDLKDMTEENLMNLIRIRTTA